MKNQIYVLTFLSLFLIANTLSGQSDSFGKDFVGAKILFIDYGNPNDLDSLNITNGLEIVYLRNLNQYVKVGIPLKVGVANVAEDINNRTLVSLDAILQLQYYQPEARFVPYLFGGGGIVWEDELGSNPQFPIGAGLNLRLGQNSYLNLQGEYRISGEENRNNLQAGVGFIYRLGGKRADRDGDGVSDTDDRCPDQAGLASTQGCPDSDGDGVIDEEDLCPETPGDPAQGGCPDSDGDGVTDDRDQCPDVAGVAALEGCPDRDGDGIVDRDDRCPTEAGSVTANGCPDRDGDGIVDREDDCPDQPGMRRTNGCPVADLDGDGLTDDQDQCPEEAGSARTQGCPDRDGDGVPDKDDRCPDKAGPYTGCPDTDGDGLIDADDSCPDQAGPTTNKGCPELEEEEREVLSIAMQAVQFETGSARLKTESYDVLDQIAAIMERYPGYRLRIGGHTDNQGDEEDNQTLSENRSKACYQYLMAAGVAPGRMAFQGFGESKPIATNDTSRGRTLNRRVEFELYVE